MKPHFNPAPGKMAVIRDRVSEEIKQIERTDGQIVTLYQTDDRADYETAWNPWGVVVAVGDSYFEGDHEVTSIFEEGDRVAIMRSGVELTLTAPDGSEQRIYALSWAGAIGFITSVCEFCGHFERLADDLNNPTCSDCGRRSGSQIVEPTARQVAAVKGSKR
jgi:hypothetical protein